MRYVELAIVVAGVLVGCGSDPKPPPAAPAGGSSEPTAVPTPTAPPPADEGKDPSKGQISISERIRKACGIAEDEAFFAYDSADVRQQDHPVLVKLAQCFLTGPLSGRTMRLVGHADPRGDEDYNMALGDQRAQNVKGFLTRKGLSGEKVETTSRGEIDATGTDEASWFRDRRVDVTLAD